MIATICTCENRLRLSEETLNSLVKNLNEAGFETKTVSDLCEIAQNNPEQLSDISKTVIYACQQRTVRSLFGWKGSEVHSIHRWKDDQIIAPVSSTFQKKYEAEDAWYPVLDKELCQNCGRCFDFCLFGVYENNGGNIQVINPQHCKNNCPACARMCPEKAIIFPKYGLSPINGGEEMEETFSREDMDAMYKERLKMKLKQRRTGITLLKDKSDKA